MGGAIAQRLLESVGGLSARVGREPFAGNGRPGDVAAELLQAIAFVGLTAVAAWLNVKRRA
jgi:hypothetical protein